MQEVTLQNKKVDMCLVGSDRTTIVGDVCNKIGTYLKAVVAYENNVPFFVALPTSTIDKKSKKNFRCSYRNKRSE